MNHWLDQLTQQQIRDRLSLPGGGATHDIVPHWEVSQSSQAAVLMPFFFSQQQWHLLFIRRAVHEGDQHSGQVAFAGGKREPGDNNLVATALREAEEEIALPQAQVEVLGQLPVHHSVSRFQITPVVGVIPWPSSLKADELEVSRIFSIPLCWLADSENYHIRSYSDPSGATFPVIYFDEYDGEILWGASARMTLTLISRLEAGRSKNRMLPGFRKPS